MPGNMPSLKNRILIYIRNNPGVCRNEIQKGIGKPILNNYDKSVPHIIKKLLEERRITHHEWYFTISKKGELDLVDVL